ncbi:Prominin-1-A [Aix galericulata]|nr:Prominin-1-A [Aix galericulata]
MPKGLCKTMAVGGQLEGSNVHGAGELIADLAQPQSEKGSEEYVEELLLYELGFLVCAAIGLLFIVLVPLVGCCFCCCRCCGLCGGRMYQKQGRRTGCRRRALYGSVLLLSALLLAGDVCAFISNTRLSQAVSGTFPNINTTSECVCWGPWGSLLHPQPGFWGGSGGFEMLGGTLRRVLLLLPGDPALSPPIPTDIGPLLGGTITSGIRSSVDEALGSLQSLLGALETLAAAFGTINGTQGRLEELQGNYSLRLGNLQKSLEQTLQQCGQPCASVSPDGVAFTANYSTIPSVEQQLEALGEVLGSGLAGDLEKVNSTLEKTPDEVQNQTRDVVTKTQDQLGLIREEIRSLQQQLPLMDAEESIGDVISNATSVLDGFQQPLTDLEGIRWSVCAVLCCLVLLVVLCNLLGLLLGPLGLKESALPTQRSCLSNAGGDFFMAGVGFSFIFSWLLMLVVLLTFLLGGNTYMLVCESWRSQQLFQLVDTPGLIPGFNLSEALGDQSGTLNFSQIYRQCQQDTALWQTLHLDQRVSLDELLNISQVGAGGGRAVPGRAPHLRDTLSRPSRLPSPRQYTEEISAAFEEVNITLSPISLLTESQGDLLLNASRAAQPPDFTHTLEQLDQTLTPVSLQGLATELEQLVDKAGVDVKKDLQARAAELRELDRELQASFSGPLQSLKENIHLAQSRAAQLEAQTETALGKANKTQEFLGREVVNIIKNETWAFLEGILDFFNTYIAWAKSSLRRDVARCKPIAQTLDNVEAITCDYLLDSLNAFWFSLGWCTIFLLPSIILAVRLAKFYRRMHFADVYR